MKDKLLKEIEVQPVEVRTRLINNSRFLKNRNIFLNITSKLSQYETDLIAMLTNKKIFAATRADSSSVTPKTVSYVLLSDFLKPSVQSKAQEAVRWEISGSKDIKIHNFYVNEEKLQNLIKEEKFWLEEEQTVKNEEELLKIVEDKKNLVYIKETNEDISALRKQAMELYINLSCTINRAREKALKA